VDRHVKDHPWEKVAVARKQGTDTLRELAIERSPLSGERELGQGWREKVRVL
jgi:hypothetical protein